MQPPGLHTGITIQIRAIFHAVSFDYEISLYRIDQQWQRLEN